ncbi:lysozyme inhibitor LprI family protein [Burkholderia multivorans]|uniref:lysozyme inhibitor LprI family protein n=1 Tax=Burkholderia multivorans TaxID=87883 RepID=UPI0021BFEBD2|nr:lysozyme inhibitor LprI family protein [Burkholderia multivorans]
MKKSLVVSFLAASAFSIAVHAATPTKLDPVKACFDRAQNQEQQARCYDQAITVQKKRLNAAYNKLAAHRKSRNDPEGIAALNQLQKNWIGWRDQTVNFLNGNAAGSASAVFAVSNNFLLDAVTKQADLLESIRDMEGGE